MSGTAATLAAAGCRAREWVPIGPLTTYRVGGPARWLVEVGTEEELSRLAGALAGGPAEVLVVGNGSNLLVHDDGFDGVVLRLGGSLGEVAVEAATVRAGGAALLPVVARRSVAEGLSGFEWAVGVPGTIGGAVRMNAGGHGSDMAAVVRGVRVVDLGTGETHDMSPAQLDFGYRRSALAADRVVVRADLGLVPGDPAEGEQAMAEVVRWRREHQPGGRNAGSVFTNPPGDSAGRLVEAAGCAGLRLGTAVVSAKHANFILVDEGGASGDVFALMVEVARRVRRSSGVVLSPETHLVGFPPFAEALG